MPRDLLSLGQRYRSNLRADQPGSRVLSTATAEPGDTARATALRKLPVMLNTGDETGGIKEKRPGAINGSVPNPTLEKDAAKAQRPSARLLFKSLSCFDIIWHN